MVPCRDKRFFSIQEYHSIYILLLKTFSKTLLVEAERLIGRKFCGNCRSKLLCNWWSVCLGIEPTLGPATRYYFLSECWCLKVAVLFLWGALCNEMTSLQFAVQSLNGLNHSEPVTILYCLIWDSPNLEGQVPMHMYPSETGWLSPKSRYNQQTVCLGAQSMQL
jgi:hypothetical protein